MLRFLVLSSILEQHQTIETTMKCHFPGVNLFFAATHEEVVFVLEQHAIDILLIDLNALHVAFVKRLYIRWPSLRIAFFGPKADFSLSLYEMPHFYYLITPFDPNQLRLMQQKYFFETRQAFGDAILLKIKHENITIQTKDLLYIYSQGRYLYVVCRDIEYVMIGKLDDVSLQLNHRFYRIHQSYVVNIDQIDKITSSHCFVGQTVKLPISRGRFKPLKDLLITSLAVRI